MVTVDNCSRIFLNTNRNLNKKEELKESKKGRRHWMILIRIDNFAYKYYKILLNEFRAEHLGVFMQVYS